MKRARPAADELRVEYKPSDFRKLERGKYLERIKAQSNVIVLDDDIADVFPNSEAVNAALHQLLAVAEKAAQRHKRPSRRGKALAG